MYQLSPARERGLLWLLALTQFTIIMDFMVMMPLGPQIMQAFAIGPAGFAAAVSAYSWCAGISGLLAATYIDRFDRRRLLLVAYVLFALSNLACALAPNFAGLLLARAFAGLTGGVLGSVVLAIASDVVPPQRRGAATGIIMTSFSLAAVAGVPIGVLMGAHLGWAAPFYLLVLLSLVILAVEAWLVPRLAAHLTQGPQPLSRVLPNLLRMLGNRAYLESYGLTFVVMASSMLVIPFISPVLVANHGVAPEHISWIYMAGGAATLFTARRIGVLSDRFGKHRLFRGVALFSILPILLLTHLPDFPLWGMILFFPLFMASVSGRMIPLQALLSTVPEGHERGAFLSINSAIQSIGTGCGAWLGGLLLTTGAGGHIEGYGTSGWLASAMVIAAVLWVVRVQAAPEPVASKTL